MNQWRITKGDALQVLMCRSCWCVDPADASILSDQRRLQSRGPNSRTCVLGMTRTYEETQIARPPSSLQKELQWDCTEEEILSATLSPPLKSFQSQIFDAGNFLCWKFCYLPAGEYTDPEASAGCVRYKRRICSFTSFTNLANFNFETLSYEKLMINKYGSLEV